MLEGGSILATPDDVYRDLSGKLQTGGEVADACSDQRDAAASVSVGDQRLDGLTCPKRRDARFSLPILEHVQRGERRRDWRARSRRGNVEFVPPIERRLESARFTARSLEGVPPQP
jgi:hypothetical protein